MMMEVDDLQDIKRIVLLVSRHYKRECKAIMMISIVFDKLFMHFSNCYKNNANAIMNLGDG